MLSKVIYYYQTFTTLEQILKENPKVTHIHLSSIHFRKNKKGIKSIYLNDSLASDKIFDSVWKECHVASQKGIKIILMVGGAGGAYDVLFSIFCYIYRNP